MNLLKKTLLIIPLVLIAITLAATFGAIHNQLSFTVSAEYFTKFKFIQFKIVDLEMLDRFKVSYIGVLASWWMGIPIGLILSFFGFIHSRPAQMFRFSLQSFLLVLVTTMIASFIGLGYGYLIRDIPIRYFNYFLPEIIENKRAFITAGSMHNASYLGGVVGIVIGIIYQFLKK